MKGLRKLRRSKGYTLAKLAHLTGISTGTLSLIENGLVTPFLNTRGQLRSHLGENINFLDVPALKVEAIDPPSNWDQTERLYREFLRCLASLPSDERRAMTRSAIKHLKWRE